MKDYAIIPIFIPHNGCPNDCVFCNQKKITAREESPSEETIISTIERNLETINASGIKNIEIGFFGGSFTGIQPEQQSYYLGIAKKYKDEGKIKGIRLSTRPDYIDEVILTNLKNHSVDLIELGVQSFDDEVLRLSERGHNSIQVKKAARLIKSFGFDLGIQLMIGLPGDTREKAVKSAEELVRLKPSVARLYPTVVLADTMLMDMYKKGEYIPFSEEKMLETATDMYEKITQAGVNVIRIGLKSTDLINSDTLNIAGDYHPAFSEIVQGHNLYRIMIEKIDDWLASAKEDELSNMVFSFTTNPKDISKLVGHNGRNRKKIQEKYPRIKFRFTGDNNCISGSINLKVE